jgi:hypothetical protein
MESIDEKKLLELIKSCDFLGKDIVNKWLESIKIIPKDLYGLVFRKFKDAKSSMNKKLAHLVLAKKSNPELTKTVIKSANSALKSVKNFRGEQVGKELIN